MKATIEYDGTDFRGWQYQPNERTVQLVLQETLKTRFNRVIRVHGSGRTDSGVHAEGQVAHFNTPRNTDPDDLRRALNAMLSDDIHVRSIEVVPVVFHARFHAVSREYRYVISLNPGPFERRYCWIYDGKLNAAAMGRAFPAILGTHDFKPFSKLSSSQKHYLCTVFSANVSRRNGRIVIDVRANRFLHSMIRALVGTLVNVGRKTCGEDIFHEIIESGRRDLVGEIAPPQGLYLRHVRYQDMELIRKLL